ncbi:MAG: type IX secretion system sortase PorU [Paraprevotella sp.]|nr:type IX secretion system sortase PorU [Paraprevotella sp.]
MRFKIFLYLLLWGMCRVAAQEFTYIDWSILQADSVPESYNEVIPLEADYRNYTYEVRLDYPEYVRLTASEAVRVARWAHDLPENPEVYSDVEVSRKRGMLDVSFVPIVRRDGKYYKLMSFKMNLIRHPKLQVRASLAVTRSASGRYADNSVLDQGRWVKIGITEDGVYRLTVSDLKRMGFNDVSRVKLFGYGGHVQDEAIDADTDFDDLEEVPLYRDDRGVLFFGKGLVSWSIPNSRGRSVHRVNTYAKQACYFLTEGDSPMTISVGNSGVSATKTLNYTPANVLYHKEEYSWYRTGRMFYEAANYALSNSHTYQLPVEDPMSSSAANGVLTVCFTAASPSGSVQVRPTVDGVSLTPMKIGSIPSEYEAAVQNTTTYSLSSLREGTAGTQVTLASTSGVEARLGYLELSYHRQLKMREPYLYIRHTEESASNLAIDANGRSGIKVWRLGRRGEPMTEMQGTWSGSTYNVPVSDPTREYVAVDVNADFPSPTYIGTVANQNLHATGPTDMVIIIPASGKLYAQAERIAEAHRNKEGLRVQIVRADQIYNEYSSGTPDATAYRRFMKMLYDRAETEADMPRYLLLFGDGVWDNRMVTTDTRGLNPDDYLLCYESDNSLSHTSGFVMEEYYGLLDDGEGNDLKLNKSDLGVGRFPVTTEAEAKIMVDKTLDYMENKNAGAWKNDICVLGDDGDYNDHIHKAEMISKLVEENYPALQVNRIYWDAYKRKSSATGNTYPGVVSDIKTQMDNGCLMVNYTGHANPRELSHELVLRLDDFSSFSSNKVPLWITAACDVSPFDMEEDNIGERAVLNTKGAAVAFLGTTRTVYSSANSMMNRSFTKYVLGRDESGRRNTIGDALRLAKVDLLTVSGLRDTTSNKLHYILLGDPALKLGVPEYNLVIDSINGQPVGENLPSADFKAGSIARIVGHVTDGVSESPVSDYSGVVSASIFDSKTEVTCLNNDGTSNPPVTYFTRDKRLYSGNDSIRNGMFSMTFPIPMDIKYSGESGRISLYAIDNSKLREANGYSENVTVGGSGDDLAADKEGPKITAYLNREDFVSGGTVNATPYFVALLEDQSGINVANTAVGHDLELSIDGNSATTYILNDVYENAFGDYSKGQLAYIIPTLSDGKHTLTFRAWDMMNNSSTVTLDFNVNGHASPELINVACTDNPARTQTTFMIHYDRPGITCDFTIEVFEFSGRKLWTHEEEGLSSDGVYPVTWNLTTSAGMPLSTGVYLYRVSVSTPDSKAVSRANKIIIQSNK